MNRDRVYEILVKGTLIVGSIVIAWVIWTVCTLPNPNTDKRAFHCDADGRLPCDPLRKQDCDSEMSLKCNGVRS